MGEHIDTRARRKKTTNENADTLARKRRVTFKNYIRELEEELLEDDLDDGITEGRLEPLVFDEREDAENFIDWATNNGFDDYSDSDIKKTGLGYEVKILSQYAHEEKLLRNKAIG